MTTAEKKIFQLKEMFRTSSTAEARHHSIIALGRTLPSYPETLKVPQFQVQGCQSTLYLFSELQESHLLFYAHSDALISAGLAALLLYVYNQESPEMILKTPPHYLADLGILTSLTPSRSNGLAHIHRRMKQDALQHLLSLQKTPS